MRTFAIGDRPIGGDRAFLIAEAGVNHNGDVGLAEKLIDAAASAGADAIKFQTFDPDLLVPPDEPKVAYQAANTGTSGTQHEMLRSLRLTPEGHQHLVRAAARRGIAFLSTPFDLGSLDLVVGLRVPAIKIGSGDVTDRPLLERAAATGLPMILSTGGSSLDEVADALSAIRGAGDPPVALLHCVTSYPASAEQADLRAMGTMRDRFDIPVGWSDHMTDTTVALAAAALGASIIEKHLTLDRTMPGPDHKASAEPQEFRAMVDAIRTIERALGDGIKRQHPGEAGTVRAARRSLRTSRALPSGHVIGPDDLVALRPADGISPMKIHEVIGRRLRRAVPAHALLSGSDLD